MAGEKENDVKPDQDTVTWAMVRHRYNYGICTANAIMTPLPLSIRFLILGNM